MKINQKNLDDRIQETVDNALKQFKTWDDPEDIFDQNDNSYVLMVETIASDDRGIYQPDKILPELEPLVVGLDKTIEDIQKGIAEEQGEEYDEDHPPEISWESEVIDLVQNASDLISKAMNKHPVVKEAKLTFSFGNSEGSGDWGMFASMEPADFKALRKSGTGARGKKTNKSGMPAKEYQRRHKMLHEMNMPNEKQITFVVEMSKTKCGKEISKNMAWDIARTVLIRIVDDTSKFNGIIETEICSLVDRTIKHKEKLKQAKQAKKENKAIPTRKYYIVMTDSFMSGWGKAEGKTNKLVIGTDDYKLAQLIEHNAKERKEMKYVSIRTTKPNYKSNIVVSYKDASELSGPWLKGYN